MSGGSTGLPDLVSLWHYERHRLGRCIYGRPQAVCFARVPGDGAGTGTILVEVRMANVCGSDLHIWRGEYDVYRGQSEPFCLSIGHEMVGRIAALGDGVTSDWAGEPLRSGDRVAYQYFCPCGECRSCRTGATPRCKEGTAVSLAADGAATFQRRVRTILLLRQPQAVFKVPDNVPDMLAGPANCALSQVIDGLGAGPSGSGRHARHSRGRGSGDQCGGRRQGTGRVAGDRDRWDRVASGAGDEFGADVTIDLNEFKSPAARVSAGARADGRRGGRRRDGARRVGRPIVAEGIEMLCSGGVYLEIGNINQRLACEFNPGEIVHGGKTILGLMWYRPESLRQACSS